MTVARAGAAAVVHNGVVYMIGGVDGRIYLRSVESARILADGRLSEWQRRRILPEARGFADAVIYRDYLYVIGGANGRHGDHLLNTVIRARIEANGELGEWQTLDETLQLPRRCAKVCLDDDRLYALGGFAGTLLDSVEATRLSPDGRPQVWLTLDQRLTMPRYVNAVKKSGQFLYLLGGHHPDKGVGLAEVEYARLDRQPLQWQATRPLNTGRYGLASAAWGRYLYALGGISGTEYLDQIERAEIGTDGRLSEWRSTTALPQAMSNFNAVVYQDSLYLLGGTLANGYSSRVYRAAFASDGSLGITVSPEEAEHRKQLAASRQAPTEPELPNQGTVVEVIASENYSYLKVEGSQGSIWLAAPRMVFMPGMQIRYSQGVYMTGFYSKALDRRFAEILFVGSVRPLTEAGG